MKLEIVLIGDIMLNIFIGTMKASKTAKLISIVEECDKNGFKYIVAYPACCSRKDNYIVSRKDNKSLKATRIFEVKDLYNYIQDSEYIFIDETQFLAGQHNIDEFLNFLEFCDKNDKKIYLFGLSLDYMGKAFTTIERVLPYADNIEVLTAKCEECGDIATRCVRYVDDKLDIDNCSSLLLIENSNVQYKSVCKNCYRKLTKLSAIK